MTLSKKILRACLKNPSLSHKDLANQFGISTAYVSKLRQHLFKTHPELRKTTQWTPNEESILLSNLHLPPRELAKILPHKKQTISAKLGSLRQLRKIPKVREIQTPKRWSPQEIEILKSNTHLSCTALSKQLVGRSPATIQKKRLKLQLYKPRPYSKIQIAQALKYLKAGYSATLISRILGTSPRKTQQLCRLLRSKFEIPTKFKRWSKEEDQKLKEWTAQGKTAASIAEKLSRSANAIALRRSQLQLTQPRKWTPEIREKIAAARAQNLPIQTIAANFGTTYRNIAVLLSKHNKSLGKTTARWESLRIPLGRLLLQGKSPLECATLLKKPIHSIWMAAKKYHGIPKNWKDQPKRKWSKQDDAILLDPTLSFHEKCRKLQRNPLSLHARKQILLSQPLHSTQSTPKRTQHKTAISL